MCGLFFVEESINEQLGTGRDSYDDILDYTVTLLRLQADHTTTRENEK